MIKHSIEKLLVFILDVQLQWKRDPGMISLTDTVGGVDSVRHESPSGREAFFSKSKLTFQKWLLLIHLWARDCSVTDAMEQAEVDTRTAVDVYQWLREVCTTKLLQTPIILGGPGIIVQIDESLFRHKPKVRIMLYGNNV